MKATVVRRLPTAGLLRREVHPAPEVPQNTNCRFADAWEEGIGQAGNEEADVHAGIIAAGDPPVHACRRTRGQSRVVLYGREPVVLPEVAEEEDDVVAVVVAVGADRAPPPVPLTMLT